MACSTIGKRVTSYTLIISFIASLSLQAGKYELGLELTYTDLDELQLFFSGSYRTDSIKTKININSTATFPDNIIVNVEPITKSSNHKELATLLAGLTDGSLNLGKYYLKKRFYHDKKFEEQIEISFLKKNKKNLESLEEPYYD